MWALRLRGVLAPARAALAVGVAGATVAAAHGCSRSECISKPDELTQLRKKSYPLLDHHHGKAKVRVLRVRREKTLETVQEYTVATRLFSPMYSRVFTDEDNSDLVATDTQKNTIYVVAQKTSAETPEDFAVDVARHLLAEYPNLSSVEVDVAEDLWKRHSGSDGPHAHGFIKYAPERAHAQVRLARDTIDKPEVTSSLTGLTVLKTTQSGFENYLHDRFTLLPETRERCLATEMTVGWTYNRSATKPDYGAVRASVREGLVRGFFGPAKDGIYSVSLQATIYDAGCLVLASTPSVETISIDTPNIHMIPFHALKVMTGKGFSDDVYATLRK